MYLSSDGRFFQQIVLFHLEAHREVYWGTAGPIPVSLPCSAPESSDFVSSLGVMQMLMVPGRAWSSENIGIQGGVRTGSSILLSEWKGSDE